MRRTVQALVCGLAFAASPVLAAQVSVLDARAVPYLDDAGRATYEAWLRTNLPRAFAVSPGGKTGWVSGGIRDTIEAIREKALQQCVAKGAPGCALYAENLDVVWPGQQSRAAPPPGPLVKTWNYALVPDARFIWHGPAAARGVVVWAHGYGGPETDNRGIQPQSLIRPLNNIGYDVVRFDREPMSDARDRAAGWLHDGLQEMRRIGYHSIVAAGQSRGAWNSLQVLDTPGLADVVIAVSPAAHGTGDSTNLTAQYDDLRVILAGVPDTRTRVAFVQFSGDTFIGDADRRTRLMQGAAPRLGALLLIDRPEGFSGHGAGGTAAFGQRYGECLMHFALDPLPPRSCPGQPVSPEQTVQSPPPSQQPTAGPDRHRPPG